MKPICPFCGKPVDVTKYGKYAPHFAEGKTRCDGSSKHYVKTVKED